MTHVKHSFVPLAFERLQPEQMIERASAFATRIARRRSVRHFSEESVPREVIEACIRAAASAPSGAHRQPWTFVVVTDPELKRAIRAAAEQEEKLNYGGRMNEEWLRALEPLGTDWNKPFLETAPALIVVFRHAWDEQNGRRAQNYYTQESVGLAAGFLLVALHEAGLVSLTHTPSPMGFLQRLLSRPESEKAFLLIPVGYPAADCEVPDLRRKALGEVLIWR
jgi:nitroreductase